jgi:hypothetical protein
MHEVLTRVLKVHVVPDNRFRLAWSSCTSRIPTTSLPGRISAHTATNLAKWKRNGSKNCGLGIREVPRCFAECRSTSNLVPTSTSGGLLSALHDCPVEVYLRVSCGTYCVRIMSERIASDRPLKVGQAGND